MSDNEPFDMSDDEEVDESSFDKVVSKERILFDKDGSKIVEKEKFIICSVCGHANSITAAQCEQCSNYLDIEGE